MLIGCMSSSMSTGAPATRATSCCVTAKPRSLEELILGDVVPLVEGIPEFAGVHGVLTAEALARSVKESAKSLGAKRKRPLSERPSSAGATLSSKPITALLKPKIDARRKLPPTGTAVVRHCFDGAHFATNGLETIRVLGVPHELDHAPCDSTVRIEADSRRVRSDAIEVADEHLGVLD
jgi:hypothetical protein